jgi:hypothetical protein
MNQALFYMRRERRQITGTVLCNSAKLSWPSDGSRTTD